MTDTTDNTVLNTPPQSSPLAPPQGAVPAPTRPAVVVPARGWWGWIPAAIGIIALLGICVAALVPASVVAEKENRRLMELQPAPYAQVPASAESVNTRLVFGELPDGVERFETDGDFLFVTVSAPSQSVLSWFAGRDDPAIDLLTEEDKFGVRTPSQRRARALQQMSSATQRAQYVALRAAGYEPEINLGQVVVEDVLCRVTADDGSCDEFFPSDEQIDPSDTLLEADGVTLLTVEDLGAALEGKQPGDMLDLLIDRPDVGQLDVTVELSASPDDPDRTIVGFQPFETLTVDLPFEVGFDTGAIGGPSAGLAFTLALIDELTPGELTGGRDIAITGEMSLEGEVGAIGGLAQKMNAVLQHGVDTILVPAGQFELSEGQDELRRKLVEAGHGDVEIVPVATLGEALVALEALGGDPLVPVNS